MAENLTLLLARRLFSPLLQLFVQLLLPLTMQGAWAVAAVFLQCRVHGLNSLSGQDRPLLWC